MRTKTNVRAIVFSAILIAGGFIFASRAHKSAQEEICSEAQEQCDKPKAQGEFIILEALNRAVMATAR